MSNSVFTVQERQIDPDYKQWISTFLLIAGINMIFFCLWFFYLGTKDQVQYINMIFTGGVGILVLMIWRFMDNNVVRWAHRPSLYIPQAVTLILIFFNSFWLIRYAFGDHLSCLTPVLSPATIFILIIPLNAVFLMTSFAGLCCFEENRFEIVCRNRLKFFRRFFEIISNRYKLVPI